MAQPDGPSLRERLEKIIEDRNQKGIDAAKQLELLKELRWGTLLHVLSLAKTARLHIQWVQSGRRAAPSRSVSSPAGSPWPSQLRSPWPNHDGSLRPAHHSCTVFTLRGLGGRVDW